MSFVELCDRARQFSSARVDLLRSACGLQPRIEQTNNARANPPRFFFDQSSLPTICELLRQRLPEQVDAIIARAGQICSHRFDLLGFQALEYVTEIDWHLDPVHNRRAPRKPWFRIPYLDFNQVGDSKIIWELNRHQHWVTLAKAYQLTGNDRFTQEVLLQWRSWHAQNPYLFGINWASTLEVAFRSLSWLWVGFLLQGSPCWSADFRKQWLHALGINARHIERHLSTYFSPNTHLIGEAVALFFIGTLCPELLDAPRWQSRGWEIVQREAVRQVQADGMHFEQSVYYHVYALDFFLHARILAALNGIKIPPDFDRTLGKMLEALCALAAEGSLPQLGDDDGGRVFDPQRNRSQDLLDPLATGAALFNREDFKFLAKAPREETIWLLGQNGLDQFDRIAERAPARSSSALKATGLFVLSQQNSSLVVDAGPQGAFTAGHGHADALSVTLQSNGRPLLIDPGTSEYVGSDSQRDKFRGTAAHNTVRVDAIDQAEPAGPFSWSRLPRVTAQTWANGKSFDLFVGSHDGYGRLPDPVIHERTVFSLDSHFFLVRDQLLGRGAHELELFWHLSPSLGQRGGSHFFGEGGQGLRLITPDHHGWSESLVEDWSSPAYGRKERSLTLRFAARIALPCEFVTLLVPSAATGSEHAGSFRSTPAESPVSAFEYETGEDLHTIVFGEPDRPWSLGSWSSDMKFLYYRHTPRSGLSQVIACQGTYIKLNDKRILNAEKFIESCEITRTGSKFEISCSDPSVTLNQDSLENGVLESISSLADHSNRC